MRGAWASVVGGAPLIWAMSHLGSTPALLTALGVMGLAAIALGRAESHLAQQRDEHAAEVAERQQTLATATQRLEALESELTAERGRVESWKACAATLEEAVEQARASRSSFLATVSHELRTPLHAIIGFTELVSDGSAGPINATQMEYLGDARAAAQHLMTLITDVLDYSKADAGKLTFSREPVPVGEVVDEVVSLVDGLARKKELLLSADCEPGLKALGDPMRVKQVLLNLVGNAIKFTPRRGRVEVTARREGVWCRLEVRDTGEGIPLAQRETLFEPFQQADSSTSRQHAGTGLGLALVKRWSQAMGGSVELDASATTGTCFVVRFPVPAVSGVVAPLEPATPRLDVVVAEYDDATRVMLTRVLESQGIAVRQASNGQRALEAIMARVPDVVVLDLMMPELDGYELLQKLRALPGGARVPVLVFSATNPQGVERERLLGADAQIFVKGSLPPSELAARVRRAAASEPLRSAA
ncbi:MAG: ATP-binding protein [Myxococcaceae bacterium]|nr:ATP-binding protein [Myxococcaceae bacterium]